MRAIRRAVNRLIYGGDTRLSDIERRLLDIARAVLPPSEQRVLDTQVQAIQRIKRYNDHRMVTFQFDRIAVAPFEDDAPEVCLVSFVVGPRSPLGALMIHRGRLSSLEFRTDPRGIAEDRWAQIVPLYRGRDPATAREWTNKNTVL